MLVHARQANLTVIVLLALGGCPPQNGEQSVTDTRTSVDVRVVLDEAAAVLNILDKRAASVEPAESDWQRLWASEGYVRLKQRQESFGAENIDERFREFLESDEPLGRIAELRVALDKWRSIDVTAAAEQAMDYLPANTRIRATIYPVIKRTTNSFVFELTTDPAIFMYVDPDRTAAKLENTLAHELHHVGNASCPDPAGIDTLGAEQQQVVQWLSAFGEGMAMLAGAGGSDVHPHATSEHEEWIVWERDVANFGHDVPLIEAFFQAVLNGTLPEAERRAALFTFINTDDVPQGAFYTVGWKMAAMVERAHSREQVVRAVCDPRILLHTYNEIAGAHPRTDGGSLPLWSESFLSRIGAHGL